MKKKTVLILMAVLAIFLISVTPAFAEGPDNAGGDSDKWLADPWGQDVWGWWVMPADLYIGPDYGAGSTPTLCSDGTWIDVIENATLLAKGHYFSDEEFTEKDWVSYKFWLDDEHPVDMILADGSSYTATEFIFLKWTIGLYPFDEIELVAYK